MSSISLHDSHRSSYSPQGAKSKNQNDQEKAKRKQELRKDLIQRLMALKKSSKKTNQVAENQFSIYAIIGLVSTATSALNRVDREIDKTKERSISKIDQRSNKTVFGHILQAGIIGGSAVVAGVLGATSGVPGLIPPPKVGDVSRFAKFQKAINVAAPFLGAGMKVGSQSAQAGGQVGSTVVAGFNSKNETKTREESHFWESKDQATSHFDGQRHGSMDDLKRTVEAHQRLHATRG